MTDFAEQQRANDRWMRRAILRTLDAAKSAGGMRGRMLMNVFVGQPEAPADDTAMLGLLTDLINAGYVEATDLRRKKFDRLGLDTQSYAVTARGTALVNQAIDPDPLIEDDRPE